MRFRGESPSERRCVWVAELAGERVWGVQGHKGRRDGCCPGEQGALGTGVHPTFEGGDALGAGSGMHQGTGLGGSEVEWGSIGVQDGDALGLGCTGINWGTGLGLGCRMEMHWDALGRRMRMHWDKLGCRIGVGMQDGDALGLGCIKAQDEDALG